VDKPKRRGRSGGGPAAAATPRRILVVEDEPSTRELLALALEAEGHVVEAVPDGASAVTRIAAGGIDLVLLDVLLPGLYGLAVCRQVRATPGGETLPMLLLTALAGAGHRRAGLAAGANDYVVKPFDVDDLLNRVRRWLRPRPGPAGGQRPVSERTRLDP
jgi:DNA-binding response OmpR family regulator